MKRKDDIDELLEEGWKVKMMVPASVSVSGESSYEYYEGGVYVDSVLPPACAPGECLLRTSLMASHTKDLIDEAAEIIANVMHQDDSAILDQLHLI